MNPTDSKNEDEVLIVGAGPIGLCLAILLRMHEIPCRLIDKLARHGDTSRSFTIHARTMELFDRIGVSEAFMRESIRNEGFVFNFKGKDARPTLRFTNLDSKHNYVAVVSQSRTEKLLLDHLKEKHRQVPEWSTELVDLHPRNGDAFDVTLRHIESSTEEETHPRWVVGCDGSHSFVRKAMGISFAGSHYEGMLMQLMDVPVTGFNNSAEFVHYFVSKQNFLLLVNLPGPNYRVIVSNMSDHSPDVSQHELFQRAVNGHIPGVNLGEAAWATKWTVYKRLAESYRDGGVFLAGDAAHIHSPAGGQGMNVGIQDVANLAWKLAFVVKGKATDELLETYELERKPIGMQVIEGTDAMHNIIMAHGKGLQDRLEKTQKPGWHDEAVNRISGLSYHYRDSVALPEKLNLPGEVCSGNRVPDVSLPDGGTLFDVLEVSSFTMLLMGSEEQMNDARRVIQSRFTEDVMKVEAYTAEDGPLMKRLGCGALDFACLIRPDGYVSLRCRLADVEDAVHYLEKWLVARGST